MARTAPRRFTPHVLLIWCVVVLGFYSFSHSKRGVYLLPLYPALATLTALYIVDAIGAPASSERLVAFFSGLYGVSLAMAGFGALLALVMIQIFPPAFASILHPVLASKPVLPMRCTPSLRRVCRLRSAYRLPPLRSAFTWPVVASQRKS